jgi:hypothetical protein
MIENIEKVLDRGEKLDLLVDKTELLQVGNGTGGGGAWVVCFGRGPKPAVKSFEQPPAGAC